METIPLAECEKIGYLQKTHGLNGKFLFIFNEKYEDSLENADVLFLKIDGLLVPFFIENEGMDIKTANQAFVKFKWINSEAKAREFTGSEVYLKKENIDIIQNKLSFENLIGFIAYNSQNQKIGSIKEVNNYAGNIVLTIDTGIKQILVPYNEELTKQLDIKNKTIQLIIPEGII